jgi:hypothetical protein
MVLLLSMFIVGGCIVSSSPSSPIITMDKGDSLEFSVVAFPATDKVQWTLQHFGIVQDTSTAHNYMFTPEMTGLYQMTLDVSGFNGNSQNRIWVINVQ